MFNEVLGISVTLFSLYMFGLGAIVGSFLNVVIYRFHTGKSLNGHSHCLSCGHGLAWYDLFPVFSYIWLTGRCRYCGCSFTPRYLLVEILTGALFVLAVTTTTSWVELGLLLFLLSVLVVVFVYDLRHFIIPDLLTGLLTIGALALLLTNLDSISSWSAISISVGAAAAGSFFLFLLWFVSKGQWLGFGDVKLAFPLGVIVGPELVFSFIVWSFWIGAGVSVLLVFLTKVGGGKLRLPFLPTTLTIKSVVPFAPFLISGCLLVYFTQINVLSLFTTF